MEVCDDDLNVIMHLLLATTFTTACPLINNNNYSCIRHFKNHCQQIVCYFPKLHIFYSDDTQNQTEHKEIRRM